MNLKAFTAQNLYSMIILVAVLSMALGGFITWIHFVLFVAGYLTGLAFSYLKTL